MITRRSLLKTAMFAAACRPGGELRGILAILLTPFTGSGRLDTEALAREVEFVEGSGVHGVVWPDGIGEWTALSPAERIAGAEAVRGAAKRRVILGVQGADLESTRRYARHAERILPDAVLCAPVSDPAAHYRAIARECRLPLMAQTAGDMSVEFVVRMREEIPTLRLVKDEAGHTLSRISEYRRTAPDLAIFTAGGRALPDEIERGASGAMPPACFAESYARIWEHCRAGRRERAIEELSRISRG
jgi:dihydrodipicolinate synthase/N-acetylneuraminate lyase